MWEILKKLFAGTYYINIAWMKVGIKQLRVVDVKIIIPLRIGWAFDTICEH